MKYPYIMVCLPLFLAGCEPYPYYNSSTYSYNSTANDLTWQDNVQREHARIDMINRRNERELRKNLAEQRRNNIIRQAVILHHLNNAHNVPPPPPPSAPIPHQTVSATPVMPPHPPHFAPPPPSMHAPEFHSSHHSHSSAPPSPPPPHDHDHDHHGHSKK